MSSMGNDMMVKEVPEHNHLHKKAVKEWQLPISIIDDYTLKGAKAFLGKYYWWKRFIFEVDEAVNKEVNLTLKQEVNNWGNN